jgi:ribosomal protein L29
MNPNEVRQLSDEQIKGEVHAAREKLFKLRTQAVTEKVENTGQFREGRRGLARLLTERRARQLAQAPGASKPAAGPAAGKSKPAAKTASKPAAAKTAKTSKSTTK